MSARQFTFVSWSTFEHWDWVNLDQKGIGGSETSHVMMCEHLARLGYDVRSYAPCPFLGPMHGPGQVPWWWCESAFEPTSDGYAGDRGGVWVLYREPRLIDKVPAGAIVWHVCQDVDYDAWTPERIARCTRIIALCEEQKRFLEFHHPEMRGKVSVSSNGVRSDIIEQALALELPRNPKRLIYASSPDRGLLHLMPILERAREMDPAIELHVYYGLDNLERIEDNERARFGENGPVKRSTDKIRAALKKPGVVWHGRMGQSDLAREWAQAGIWCHPSNFQETSCITSMDAQALGAIPITNPIWAVGENVRHGVLIDGNVADYVVAGLYAVELVNLANDPNGQAAIRSRMMPEALQRFRWEVFAEQWACWAEYDLAADPAVSVESGSGCPAVSVDDEILEARQ